VDLCGYMTPKGIEARFAEVEVLREAGEREVDAEISGRLAVAAGLREMLEAHDARVIEELLNRLEVEYLDDLTIVLEICTQNSVEDELRTAILYRKAAAS